MYSNCTNEVVIKTIGKISQEFNEFSDLQKQIKLRKILEESFYNYEITSKETSLVSSDIEEKMQIFFASKRLEEISEKTIKNYTYILTKFISHLIKPLNSITTMDMRLYLSVISKNIKANSTNSIIYCFKSFFSWLLDNEYITKNPMNQIKATKIPKKLRHGLSDEELELLRQSCKTLREELLIEFLVSTGCRLSEVININKQDINWVDLSLSVIGKGNKERIVYFNIKTKILLEKYLSQRSDMNSALFISIKSPYNRLSGRTIEKELKKISERTDINKSIYPHLLRHTFATNKLNSGMQLNTIQKLMGHESADTTLIYAELSQENIKHEYIKNR